MSRRLTIVIIVICLNNLFYFIGVVFDPFDLTLEVTPKAVHEALKSEEFTKALVMSLKLNEPNLVTLVLERVPYRDSKCS